ncbi:MAG: DUF1993 family protein, partial [Methylobacter sp.]
MKDQRNNRLITKVLIIGVLIAVLSYLFHPGVPFTGLSYAQGFVLPNFYFHVTCAYALLRHRGVPI